MLSYLIFVTTISINYLFCFFTMDEDSEDQMSWVKSPMSKGLSYDKDHNLSNFKTTHFLSIIHDCL